MVIGKGKREKGMFELARIQKEYDKAQLGSRLTGYRWLALTAARGLLLMTLIGVVSVFMLKVV